MDHPLYDEERSIVHIGIGVALSPIVLLAVGEISPMGAVVVIGLAVINTACALTFLRLEKRMKNRHSSYKSK